METEVNQLLIYTTTVCLTFLDAVHHGYFLAYSSPLYFHSPLQTCVAVLKHYIEIVSYFYPCF